MFSYLQIQEPLKIYHFDHMKCACEGHRSLDEPPISSVFPVALGIISVIYECLKVMSFFGENVSIGPEEELGCYQLAQCLLSLHGDLSLISRNRVWWHYSNTGMKNS